MRALRIFASGLLVTLLTVPAFAQGTPPIKAARDNYDKGVAAVKSQKWSDAITALTAAIIASPCPR